MDEDALSDVIQSNIVSRQVGSSHLASSSSAEATHELHSQVKETYEYDKRMEQDGARVDQLGAVSHRAKFRVDPH